MRTAVAAFLLWVILEFSKTDARISPVFFVIAGLILAFGQDLKALKRK